MIGLLMKEKEKLLNEFWERIRKLYPHLESDKIYYDTSKRVVWVEQSIKDIV